MAFISSFIGIILGVMSLGWQIYEKVFKKPKLIIQFDKIITKQIKNPQHCGLMTCCTGEVRRVLIPIINTGRTPAVDCRAKARYRVSSNKNSPYSEVKWSPWYTLHWYENSDYLPAEGYKPITLNSNSDISYVDLLLCYYSEATTSTAPSGRIEEKFVSLYSKPMLLGQLTKVPCPKIPEEKTMYPILYDSSPNSVYDYTYEIELKIICSNTGVETRFYIEIEKNKEKQIEIYMIKDKGIKSKILTC